MKRRAAHNIDKCLSNPLLLGASLGDPKTWSTWVAVLKATFCVPLSNPEFSAFQGVAGRAPIVRKCRNSAPSPAADPAKAGWPRLSALIWAPALIIAICSAPARSVMCSFCRQRSINQK
jgi:hypothetical protein